LTESQDIDPSSMQAAVVAAAKLRLLLSYAAAGCSGWKETNFLTPAVKIRTSA